MKKLLFCCLSSLVFILINLSAFAQEPLNWTVDEINPGEDVLLIPDETVFTEGVKSCHMQLNSGAVPYLISDIFYISPGASYEFSIDIFDNDTSGQVKVYADFYDTYGFDIFGQPPVFSADSSEWQKISWTGVIPSQAVVGYILVKFYNQPDPYHFTETAQVWIDNVQFREAGGNNLVANGGFEDWVVGVYEEGNDANLLSIYPNPAWDAVNVKIPESVSLLIITDLVGKEVRKISNISNAVYRLEIADLPEGLYILSAVEDNGNLLQGKLMVSRR